MLMSVTTANGRFTLDDKLLWLITNGECYLDHKLATFYPADFPVFLHHPNLIENSGDFISFYCNIFKIIILILYAPQHGRILQIIFTLGHHSK